MISLILVCIQRHCSLRKMGFRHVQAFYLHLRLKPTLNWSPLCSLNISFPQTRSQAHTAQNIVTRSGMLGIESHTCMTFCKEWWKGYCSEDEKPLEPEALFTLLHLIKRSSDSAARKLVQFGGFTHALAQTWTFLISHERAIGAHPHKCTLIAICCNILQWHCKILQHIAMATWTWHCPLMGDTLYVDGWVCCNVDPPVTRHATLP